ncbi:MAG TPA: stage II sporulation protein P [Firmicutes bacterium]|nr:stage II sporulation protein P [Bacillota bacterium]
MKKNVSRLLTILVIVILCLNLPLKAGAVDIDKFFDMLNDTELTDGSYYTMVDREGNTIMRTARIIHVGDEYLTKDNNVYRVIRIEDKTAEARYLRTLSLEKVDSNSTMEKVATWFRKLAVFPKAAEPVQQENKTIAIYHSHGAESYVPSDGTDSDPGGGGILEVGDSFAAALKRKGINSLKSDETHVPHDAGAYIRSRRTAEELIQKNPNAIFDVHRDAVPPEEYLTELEGEEKVQIQLVVGRENQNMASNRQFAEELKATADNIYPGLVKGIFMANGNYNQDMSARSLLLEVGAHENTREGAEESIALFSDVVDQFLYGSEEGQEFLSPGFGGEASRTALRSALWLVLALVAGVALYLVISTGSIEGAVERVKNFRKTELKNLIGGFNKDEENKDNEEGN